MSYFFERNIAEVQKDYTKFLTDILSPLLYEGLKSIYDDSKNIHQELIEKSKRNPNVQALSFTQVFQSRLKEIPELNSTIIEGEANRIKSGSRCYEWFDDLVKATIKSKILLLTFANGKTDRKKYSLDKSHYENINVNEFIHKCYIECSKLFYNNPYLFLDNIKPSEIKSNQLIIIEAIKDCVKNAIMRSLPMNLVLKDFIETEVFEFLDDIPQSRFNNVRDNVDRDIFGGAQNEFQDIDEDDNIDEMGYSQYDKEVKDRLENLKNNIEDESDRDNSYTENGSESDSNSESKSSSKSNSSSKSESNNEDEDEDEENKEKRDNMSIERINNEIDKNIINEPVKLGGSNKVSLLDIVNEGKEKSIPINPQIQQPINPINQINLMNQIDQIDQQNNQEDLDKLKFFAKYLD
uniref:Uncharacterized protein n=1 Tax=viral metagenome TaxID=1070528 RepID=A0A6C0ADB8_9ZZZZ